MPRKTAPRVEVPAEVKPVPAKSQAARHKPTASRPVRPAVKQTAKEPATELPHGEIQRLAYNYWLERGCTPGDPTADWLRAEAEVRQRYLRNTASTRP